MKKWRIIFFGTDDFSAPAFRELLGIDENGVKLAKSAADFCQVVAVVTKPDVAKSRGHKIESPLVAQIAQTFNSQNSERKIAIFQPTKLREIADQLRELQPDAGVLVAYGKIVPPEIIDIFAKKYEVRDENSGEISETSGAGIINFHPSLLPKLRGPSPIETAILSGARETGLTLMKLVREMDAGPILYQEKISLDDRVTSPELYKKFAQRGALLFRENLSNIFKNDVREIAQNDALATYCHMINKDDGILDPAQMTADECDRRVRAFASWPKARLNFAKISRDSTDVFAKFPDQNIIIVKAKPLANFAGDTWPDVVPCAENTFLQIEKIISPKSGREMTVAEYLRGVK